MLRGLGIVWAIGACAWGCVGSSSSDEAPAVPPAAEGTVIGTLQTHDRALVVLASDGAGEPRYAVATRDGRIVSEAVDADTLERDHPDLADALRTGTARPHLDARLDVSPTLDASLSF